MEKDIKAYILDLDGVVTHTAKLHTSAWKQLFDEYNERLRSRGESGYDSFDVQRDYLLYVDGRPRQDGVRSFLAARGIHLPEGRPDDSPDLETVFGLGNRKNSFFEKELEKTGPVVFPDAVEALRYWRVYGFKTAIASSSKNCARILNIAGLTDLFDVRVDGNDLQRWNLPGKPAPDMFLAAARLLDIPPIQAAVLEDAISGARAARSGNFGLVVGVARFGHPELLLEAGADVIVSKLTELLPLREQSAA